MLTDILDAAPAGGDSVTGFARHAADQKTRNNFHGGGSGGLENLMGTRGREPVPETIEYGGQRAPKEQK